LISLRGSSNRTTFFVVWLGITALLFIVWGLLLVIPYLSLLLIPLVWMSVVNVVRRLHDLGHSGWLFLAALVPIVNLLFFFYLLFKPGQRRGWR